MKWNGISPQTSDAIKVLTFAARARAYLPDTVCLPHSGSERETEWGRAQGCPTIPRLSQTRLWINWASEAAFGLILYVSGPRLRRGHRQSNKSVCQLTATSDGFPPVTAVIPASCSQPAERSPNRGSKCVASVQACTLTHSHTCTHAWTRHVCTCTASLSAAEIRLSQPNRQLLRCFVTTKWQRCYWTINNHQCRSRSAAA